MFKKYFFDIYYPYSICLGKNYILDPHNKPVKFYSKEMADFFENQIELEWNFSLDFKKDLWIYFLYLRDFENFSLFINNNGQ